MRTSIGLAMMLAVAACGSKGDGKAGGGGKAAGAASCHSAAYKECTEYNADNRVLGDDHLKKICDAVQGTFATTACPAADRLGGCQKPEGKKVFYKDYAIAAADLQRECGEGGGTWQAP